MRTTHLLVAASTVVLAAVALAFPAPTSHPPSTTAVDDMSTKVVDSTSTKYVDTTTVKMMDATTSTKVMDSTTGKPRGCPRGGGRCIKKPVTKLMLLLVHAKTKGTSGKKLSDGDSICPADYGYDGFSIAALMPYAPKYVHFYVDGNSTWREWRGPYSIAGDTSKMLLKPWKKYPAEGKQFVLKVRTDRGELSLKLAIKCSGGAVSPTSGSPTTTMSVDSSTTALLDTSTKGMDTTTKKIYTMTTKGVDATTTKFVDTTKMTGSGGATTSYPTYHYNGKM
jgi:hypothetical protein